MSEYCVLLVNETGTDDSVISALRNIETVKAAYGTFGTFDVLTKLESADEIKLEQDISRRLRRIPHIRSTLTLEIIGGSGFRKTTKVENEVLESHMTRAFVIIHCSRSNERQIIENLRQIPEIIECDVLIGSYEIICKVVAPSYNEISSILTSKIRKIPNIKSTSTLNIVENQGFEK